jgi:hypothetical protein
MGPSWPEVVVMKQVLAIFVTLTMIFSSFGFLATGQATAPNASVYDKKQITEPYTTYSYGRMSRAYQDLSTWKGFNGKNASVDFLIVTVDSFVDAAMPLAQWKTEKGLNTAIVTTGSIYAAYTGLDDAQKIHNYLRDFKDHNPTFKWLLLLGDSDQNNVFVPARHLWTGAAYIDWYIKNSTVSDYYYSALDSSWNLDNDNTWGETGEVDWTPELYVGRIPANSAANAKMNIDKSIKYEKDPYVGVWMKKALLVGALYDLPNVIGNWTTRTGEDYYEWWQDNGKEAIDVIHSNVPSNMNIKTLFDYNVTPEGNNPPIYWGGNYTPAKDELNQASMNWQFNQGNSIVASASHAWVWAPDGTNFISRGIIDYGGTGTNLWYNDLYMWSDARDAVNTDMLSFWYASACIVGNWSQTSNTPEETYEAFFRNQNGGGVIGLVAASHGDYRGEQNNVSISDGDTYLLEDYWKQFFTTGEFRPGQTLAINKIDYRNHLKNDLKYTNEIMDYGFARDSMFVYNLLGDPEVQVKDKTTGLPVKDATVALWGPTQYVSAKTAANGKAMLTTNGVDPELVNVTITAHNYKYLKGSLNIVWKPADLSVTANNITFNKPLYKVGDPVTISAQVWNLGEMSASNVDVKFYFGDPASGGTEIGTKTIGSLGPHVSATVTADWTAQDGSKLICVVVDPLSSITDYNRANNKACKSVEGTSRDLAIFPEDITFDKAVMRSDYIPAIGNNTTVKIRVTVENRGPQIVDFVYLRLFDGDPKTGGKRIGYADYRLDSVPAQGMANRTVDWNATAPGEHDIYVLVDPSNVLKEYDENNNNASVKVFSDLPPKLSPIADITTDEDSDVIGAFCLFTYVDDPDNTFDELKVRIVSNTNPNIVINITNQCVDVIPKDDFNGFGKVTIGVSDGIFEAQRSFTVTVLPVNDQPRVTNPGKILAHEGVPVDIFIQATDPDAGTTLTYSEDSSLFQINEKTGEIKFTPTRADAGTHVVKITVSDGDLQASVTFTIEVTVNNKPPVLVIKEKEWVFIVNKAKKYTFTVSDPDKDPVTLSDTFQFADVSQEGYLAFTPMKSQVGKYNVTISASDGFVTVNRTVDIIIKKETKPGTKIDSTWLYIGLLAITLIVVVVVLAVVLSRRKTKSEESHGEAYNSLYAADEKRRQQEMQERRREERMRQRVEARGEPPAAAAPAPVVEETAPAPFAKCPKCNSPKIKQMGKGEWMCMKCGKIF